MSAETSLRIVQGLHTSRRAVGPGDSGDRIPEKTAADKRADRGVQAVPKSDRETVTTLSVKGPQSRGYLEDGFLLSWVGDSARPLWDLGV